MRNSKGKLNRDTAELGHKCSICGNRYLGFGNNAKPVNEGRCCDTCNLTQVVPMRLIDYVMFGKVR